MHSIKAIRENPDFFKKKIEERNTKLNIDDLLTLDKKNREIIQKKLRYEDSRYIVSFPRCSPFINGSIMDFYAKVCCRTTLYGFFRGLWKEYTN